jgi:hypothetical protein
VTLGSMKEGGKKAINMSKTWEVLQGLDESPRQFYEHLCEDFYFTPPFSWRLLKISRWLMLLLLARPRGT